MQEPLPVDAALPAHRTSAEPPASRRAVSASQAVRELGYGASGERGKQITQVRLVRGTAQHGTELEDLFDRPQRRAVVIVDRVLVANLGLRREDHHADRPDGPLGEGQGWLPE